MLHLRYYRFLVFQACLVGGIALIVALAVYGAVGGGGLVAGRIHALCHSFRDSLLVAAFVSHGAGGVALVRNDSNGAIRRCL